MTKTAPIATTRNRIVVFQDGGRFYDVCAKRVIFRSRYAIKDWNSAAAKLARQEFEQWAATNGVDYIWDR